MPRVASGCRAGQICSYMARYEEAQRLPAREPRHCTRHHGTADDRPRSRTPGPGRARTGRSRCGRGHLRRSARDGAGAWAASARSPWRSNALGAARSRRGHAGQAPNRSTSRSLRSLTISATAGFAAIALLVWRWCRPAERCRTVPGNCCGKCLRSRTRPARGRRGKARWKSRRVCRAAAGVGARCSILWSRGGAAATHRNHAGSRGRGVSCADA